MVESSVTVKSEKTRAITPIGDRLAAVLAEQRVRCTEILSRQNERLRLAGEELGRHFEVLSQRIESGPAENEEKPAAVLEEITPLITALDSAVRALQEGKEQVRDHDAEYTEAVSRLAAELTAVRKELGELRALKENLEQQLAAQQSRAEPSRPWELQEAELRAEFETERNRWTSQWHEREATFNALLLRCSQLEEELEALRAQQVGQANSDELQSEYQAALAELRELRLKNVELEKKLAQKGATATGSSAEGGKVLDWEAEKRRILAALEAEAENDPSPERTAEQVRIQDVIKQTEAALAAKDEEIAELRKLLEDQATNIGSVAVGAAALERFLDQDEVIRQQREHLRQLEEEWKDKLRKAELEVSLERAKIARERAVLEEKQRELDQRLAKLEGSKPQESEDNSKPSRGRWLSRLGLNSSSDGDH